VKRKLYKEDDKIMVLKTGEVFTVLADISEQGEPGIVVKDESCPLLWHSEVRPAGRTRERADAGKGITEPDTPPPPPGNRVV